MCWLEYFKTDVCWYSWPYFTILMQQWFFFFCFLVQPDTMVNFAEYLKLDLRMGGWLLKHVVHYRWRPVKDHWIQPVLIKIIIKTHYASTVYKLSLLLIALEIRFFLGGGNGTEAFHNFWFFYFLPPTNLETSTLICQSVNQQLKHKQQNATDDLEHKATDKQVRTNRRIIYKHCPKI